MNRGRPLPPPEPGWKVLAYVCVCLILALFTAAAIIALTEKR
jgi:hypothetical protein